MFDVELTKTFENCAVQEGLTELDMDAIKVHVQHDHAKGRVLTNKGGLVVKVLAWQDFFVTYVVHSRTRIIDLLTVSSEDPHPPKGGFFDALRNALMLKNLWDQVRDFAEEIGLDIFGRERVDRKAALQILHFSFGSVHSNRNVVGEEACLSSLIDPFGADSERVIHVNAQDPERWKMSVGTGEGRGVESSGLSSEPMSRQSTRIRAREKIAFARLSRDLQSDQRDLQYCNLHGQLGRFDNYENLFLAYSTMMRSSIKERCVRRPKYRKSDGFDELSLDVVCYVKKQRRMEDGRDRSASVGGAYSVLTSEDISRPSYDLRSNADDGSIDAHVNVFDSSSQKPLKFASGNRCCISGKKESVSQIHKNLDDDNYLNLCSFKVDNCHRNAQLSEVYFIFMDFKSFECKAKGGFLL